MAVWRPPSRHIITILEHAIDILVNSMATVTQNKEARDLSWDLEECIVAREFMESPGVEG